MVAHHGHNPLGQLAVYLMWLIITLLGLTGWVSRTDAYWGEDWPVNLHQFLSQTLMLLVVLHLIAIFTVSYMSRRHLLKQMIDGKQHEL
jgi:cytochrome b